METKFIKLGQISQITELSDSDCSLILVQKIKQARSQKGKLWRGQYPMQSRLAPPPQENFRMSRERGKGSIFSHFTPKICLSPALATALSLSKFVGKDKCEENHLSHIAHVFLTFIDDIIAYFVNNSIRKWTLQIFHDFCQIFEFFIVQTTFQFVFHITSPFLYGMVLNFQNFFFGFLGPPPIFDPYF